MQKPLLLLHSYRILQGSCKGNCLVNLLGEKRSTLLVVRELPVNGNEISLLTKILQLLLSPLLGKLVPEWGEEWKLLHTLWPEYRCIQFF